MIPHLSRIDRIVGWLACKAIKLCRITDAQFDTMCGDGISWKMASLVRDYRMVRECERKAGDAK